MRRLLVIWCGCALVLSACGADTGGGTTGEETVSDGQGSEDAGQDAAVPEDAGQDAAVPEDAGQDAAVPDDGQPGELPQDTGAGDESGDGAVEPGDAPGDQVGPNDTTDVVEDLAGGDLPDTDVTADASAELLPAAEDTVAACKDKKDNDADGAADCDDPDCQAFVFCLAPSEVSSGDCSDGKDNDDDGAADCDDLDCQGFVFCLLPQETSAAECQDGLDNDVDGKSDCADEDCQGFVFCLPATEMTAADCQDGLDNDEDGLPDCKDDDCQGFTFCAIPGEDTSNDCSDGLDNDDDGAVDCADTDCIGFVFCGAAAEDTFVACQDGIDNDGDGAVDCSDSGCFAVYVCSVYYGFPLIDSWGSVWDGMERPKATWAAAVQKCGSVGGRLPTIAELYRNNVATGSADLGGPGAEFLWTVVPVATAGQVVTVRLSDGTRQAAAKTATAAYRCTWPKDDGEGFAGSRCFGPPGAGCVPFQHGIWNVDAQDRPAADWVSASTECSMLGAGLPVLAEYAQLIHSGAATGSDAWLWTGNSAYWYSGGVGSFVVKWKGLGTDDWNPTYPNTLSLAWHSTPVAYRCVGLSSRSQFPVAAAPTCTGKCFSTGGFHRSPLLADPTDRATTGANLAFESCRSLGGYLPTGAEFGDLVHMDWSSPTDLWLWVGELISWYYNGWGFPVEKWTAAAAPNWSYLWTTTFSYAEAKSAYGYRCVWLPKGPTVPECAGSLTVKWSGSTLVCAAATGGTSGGNAYNGAEMVDDWSDAWDALERPAATWAEADADCKKQGGRLPLSAEVFRSNAKTHLGPTALGKEIDVNWLWTSVRTGTPAQHLQVRVSDGTTNAAGDTTKAAYRCTWPKGEAEVLWRRNCLTVPGAGCFIASDGLSIDAYDRPAMDWAAALNECLAAGGTLPDGRQILSAIFSGAPNGSDAWIWTSDAEYWFSGGYGVDIVKWLGAGSAAWMADVAVHNVDAATGKRAFRCVFDPNLR